MTETKASTPKTTSYNNPNVPAADIGLNRDVFLRTLMRELSGTLQDLVGIEEASGFISVVGKNVGHYINDGFKNKLHLQHLDKDTVADVLVSLKERIEGDFYVIEEDDEKIVFGNRTCPFGDKVKGRPSLCMMTSNVFGTITANNLGYAKVDLEETIADGHQGCRVTVYITPSEASMAANGREYMPD